jgi:hypothetical protein
MWLLLLLLSLFAYLIANCLHFPLLMNDQAIAWFLSWLLNYHTTLMTRDGHNRRTHILMITTKEKQNKLHFLTKIWITKFSWTRKSAVGMWDKEWTVSLTCRCRWCCMSCDEDDADAGEE